MKTVCKKLFSLLLVAVLLVSAIPFQAFAAETLQLYVGIQNVAAEFAGYPLSVYTGIKIGAWLPKTSIVQAEYNSRVSDGKVFDGWYFTTGVKQNQKVDTNAVLSSDMANGGNIGIEARFVQPDVKVTLNANGGKVDPASVTYKHLDTYGSKLPAPTRDGFVFAGWFKNLNDETSRVSSTDVIEGNVTLYAKWEAGSLPVVFQGWIEANKDWSEITRLNPTTGKSLKDSGLSLPVQTGSYTTRPGYSVDKDHPWVDSNGKVFTVDTVINAVTYVRPNFVANTYKMTYDYECDELSNETVEVKFGSVVNLKQPTRANHVFRGWLVVQDNYKELKTGDTYNYGDITLVAQWAPKGTVELRVYRDDTDGFKTYYYSGAILGGELNLNDCKIQNYLKGSYSFDGWYDYNGWVSYLGTKSAKGVEEASNSITRLEKVTTSNTTNSTVTVIYGMVKGYKADNSGTGTGSNNANGNVNNNTADKTNPQTGDTIMIAMTTMALAAAALVTMYELKKRKMI